MNDPITGWQLTGIILLLVAIIIATYATGIREWWQRLTRDRAQELLVAHARDELKLREAILHAGHVPMPRLGMPEGFIWPGDCPNCQWWIPAPSEAEDAVAVYRPCPVHDPALWAEMERRIAQ